MFDIHTHILMSIDDGAKTIDESIEILKSLERQGVTKLVLTPHYIESSKYICNNSDKTKLFNDLNKKIKEEQINIEVYLGNEIFISPNIIELIKTKQIQTINNSRYLLIEFPIMNLDRNIKNIISELHYAGYRVILAHPERYFYVNDDIGILDDYLRMGVLLQGNYESLYGRYGKKAEKTLKKLLKKGYISFLASDIHHNDIDNIEKMKKKLRRYASKKDIKEMLHDNFLKVINDENIE